MWRPFDHPRIGDSSATRAGFGNDATGNPFTVPSVHQTVNEHGITANHT